MFDDFRNFLRESIRLGKNMKHTTLPKLDAAILAGTILLVAFPLRIETLFLPRDGALFAGGIDMHPISLTAASSLGLYCFAVTKLTARPNGLSVSREILRACLAGRYAILRLLPIPILAAIYINGLFYYYVATATAIAIHHGLIQPPQTYAWSSASNVEVTCTRFKGSRGPIFAIGFPDGSTVDLWLRNNSTFLPHLATISPAFGKLNVYRAEPAAAVKAGMVTPCPPEINQFLNQHASKP